MSMSMVFAKQADGYHGYVTPVLATGFPRFGLVNADFGTVIRNPQDTADLFNAITVTELGGNAIGSYKFTFPSSFLLTHGVGNYLVRVFVNTTNPGGSGPPNFIGTISKVLKVTENDLDDLATDIDSNTTLLTEVWQRLGLDAANPMATSETQITVAGITINITDVGGVVTLTRV